MRPSRLISQCPSLLLLTASLFIASPVQADFQEQAQEPTPAEEELLSTTYTITQVYRYDLQVVRIHGRSLTVDIEGQGRRRFDVPRDFTFEIDGQDLTVGQLKPGMRLRAYVTQTERGELILLKDENSDQGVAGEVLEGNEGD